MSLYSHLKKNQAKFQPVLPFNKATQQLHHFNFTHTNENLPVGLASNLPQFTQYVQQQLDASGAQYGYGGYAEHRSLYDNFTHFTDAYTVEPRQLHLGVDIWAPAGTPVCAPYAALVHSMAYNNNPGDYGATIILSHQLDMFQFYTLYGHVSLLDIDNLREGMYLVGGETFAHIGAPTENGNWPPHLHFQIIEHLGNHHGDYPGVCRNSQKETWLANSPDPEVILQML